MGRIFKAHIDVAAEGVYCCSSCKTHLAAVDDTISRQFQGRHGKAYLIANVLNVTPGPLEDRTLMTGLHTVCDIFCTVCDTLLGWKYEHAHEPSQKYKEGKYILEKQKIRRIAVNGRQEVIHRVVGGGGGGGTTTTDNNLTSPLQRSLSESMEDDE
eukprot:PhF_6_TR18878/c8_g1_i1/m.27481